MRCSPPKLRFQAVIQVLYPNLLDLSLANIRVSTVGSVPFGLYFSPLDSKVLYLLIPYYRQAASFCELAFAGFVVGWICLFLRQVIYHWDYASGNIIGSCRI